MLFMVIERIRDNDMLPIYHHRSGGPIATRMNVILLPLFALAGFYSAFTLMAMSSVATFAKVRRMQKATFQRE